MMNGIIKYKKFQELRRSYIKIYYFNYIYIIFYILYLYYILYIVLYVMFIYIINALKKLISYSLNL